MNMMCKIVEHFISDLQQECKLRIQEMEMRDFDSLARKKKEGKLYDLLSEMISTERIYVADLEEV